MSRKKLPPPPPISPRSPIPPTPSPKYHFPPPNLEEEGVTFSALVATHRDKLPLRVKVTKGLYSQNEDCSIASDDLFNVHFVKSMEVVQFVTSQNASFFLPADSSLRIAPVYDPNSNEREAKRGFLFPQASEIMEMSVMPVVFVATVSYSDKMDRINANELFLNQGMTTVNGERFLQAYSPLCKKEKLLSTSCKAHFTTRPQTISFPVVELMPFIKVMIPMRMMLFPDTSDPHSLPDVFSGKIVKLTAEPREKKWFLTTSSQDEDVESMMELPVDLDIEVTLEQMSPTESRALKEQMESLSLRMSQLEIQRYKEIDEMDKNYEVQNELYASSLKNKSSLDDDDDGSEYVDLAPVKAQSDFEQRLSLLEFRQSKLYAESSSSLQSDVEKLKSGMDKATRSAESMAKKHGELEAEVASLRKELSASRAKMDSLQEKLASMQLAATTSPGHGMKKHPFPETGQGPSVVAMQRKPSGM